VAYPPSTGVSSGHPRSGAADGLQPIDVLDDAAEGPLELLQALEAPRVLRDRRGAVAMLISCSATSSAGMEGSNSPRSFAFLTVAVMLRSSPAAKCFRAARPLGESASLSLAHARDEAPGRPLLPGSLYLAWGGG